MRSGGNSGICRAYATQGCVDHFGFGVGFDGGHEVQIVADGCLVGARLRPFVADQADALDGRESGFNLRDQSSVLARRIGAAIVALAAGIGEEEAIGGRLES